MANKTAIIVDYGAGNIRSALKAFEKVIADEALNFTVRLSDRAEDVAQADHIVLPGQGAFGDCMAGLSALEGMVEALNEAVLKKGKPYLGICVGMQLMATRGYEHGVHAGLDWIPGEVVPLKPDDPALKIPHMGWNVLHIPAPGGQDNRHSVLRGMRNEEHYYFVHSFMFQCEYSHHIAGLCDYGGLFPAVIARDNMVGVQFHPEKSQHAGLRLISDFLQWRP